MVGDSVAVVHGERVQDRLPALDPAGHVLTVFLARRGHEIEDFHGGLFGRKMAAVANRSAEPRIERLDGVGRVDDAPYLVGVAEQGNQIGPVSAPEYGNGWILRVPSLGETLELGLSVRIGFKSPL